ncbi:NAD-dependent epimerase/dehydratase family protein [Bordetella bronchiseptica]|uniref:NAD-dependent epimerase/dehydratase family protein n=1 Tax=Bordetella bronchiseptica TaxID=518 RepID=UPI00028F8460|nr:NAD(P)-dependent oxidoreductase [Bordetella bronchiseptica]KAK68985.1 NAD dependent epimerase/dehydratase domain protein [Bordetella bronchiseptica MO211]CCN16461.1 putative UDP-glucose 4-epimerase [Bordetella bronchiseptica MO211]
MSGRIVVTGCHGLVGAEVLASLRHLGREAVGVGRQMNAQRPAQVVDLAGSEAAAALRCLRESGRPIDAVVHCAASFPAAFDSAEAVAIAQTNRRIDSTVIDFCHEIGARLVYCSSSSVYGRLDSTEVAESRALERATGYVAEKIWAEEEIAKRLPSYATLRLCAPYGPGQKTRTVLRIFIERALQGAPILYFGTGSREQDFVHVRDIAAAIVAALDRPTVNGVFNISGGRPITMRELGMLVSRVIADGRVVVRAADRPDPQDGWRARFDLSNARSRLEWKPEMSLEAGIAQWAQVLKEQGDALGAAL